MERWRVHSTPTGQSFYLQIDPDREATLAQLGVGQPIHDPDIDAIRAQVGLDEPLPNDCPPRPQLDQIPDDEWDALRAWFEEIAPNWYIHRGDIDTLLPRLKEGAPKAYDYADDGLWLRYPCANRKVRAGDPRTTDRRPSVEGLALHQAGLHGTRSRSNRKREVTRGK